MHFYVHVNTLKLSVNLTAIIEGTGLKMIGSMLHTAVVNISFLFPKKKKYIHRSMAKRIVFCERLPFL